MGRQKDEPIGATYLTSGQAATRLRISKRTLLRAVAQGALRPTHHTPGGHLRFCPAEVETYAHVLAGAPGAGSARSAATASPAAAVAPRHVFAATTACPVDIDPQGCARDANPTADALLGCSLAALLNVDALPEPDALLGAVLTHAPILIATFDRAGICTFCGGEGIAALGLRANEGIGQTLSDFFPGQTEMHDGLSQALDGRATTVTGTLRSATFEARWAPLHDAQRRITGAVSVATDITARVRAEEALHASEAHFRTLIERAPVAACIVSRDGVYELVNDAYCTLVGHPPTHLLGRSLGYTLPPAIREEVARRFGTGGRGLWAGETTIVNSSGEERTVIISRMGIVGTDGKSRLVCFLMDITDRKHLEIQLAHLAHHDPLTGLPNRTLFVDRLTQALSSAARAARPLSVLLLDLDRFKWVNDTLGHDAGDALLRAVGDRLSKVLRGEDTVARLGGDEFVVLLPDTDEAGTMRVARKIIAALSAPVELHGRDIAVGGSVGVVLYPAHGDNVGTLLRHADAAMYTAKRAGGGVALYVPGTDAHADEPLALTG